MGLNDLRNEARNNLVLTADVIATQGRDIDVGEQFTVRFTVRNHFSGSNDDVGLGHAHFNNVALEVGGSPHATVVGGNRTIPMADHLGFGNSASTDVVFNATSRLPDGFLSWPSENYANVRILADFDVVRFFRVASRASFFTQIDVG